MQRFVPTCGRFFHLALRSESAAYPIKIIKNPPNLLKYYTQACHGIYEEYKILMFPEDITFWQEGYSSLFTYVAIDEDLDELVSCCLGGFDEESLHGDVLATGGCFYTRPEHRGTGISKEVLMSVINDAGPHNTGCHGFLGSTRGDTSRDKYINLGYGVLQPHCLLKVEIDTEDLILDARDTSFIIKDFNEVNCDEIVAYDNTVSSRRREKFMKLRLKPNIYTFTKIVFDSSGKICGICCFRLGRSGALQGGPFYANSKKAAHFVIQSALKDLKLERHTKLIFHCPTSNQEAMELFQTISNGKAKSMLYAQQQFNKKLVHHNWERVYSVTDTTLSLV